MRGQTGLSYALGAALLLNSAHAQFDVAAIAQAGPPPLPRILVNAPSQTVKYDHVAVETAAAAEQLLEAGSHDSDVSKRDACDPQWLGKGPVPDPDTPEAFLAFDDFSKAATAATTPAGYKNTFQNLKAMNNALGYMGYSLLDSYDVDQCSKKCDAIDGCAAFNVAFERSPSLDPSPSGGNCDQPATSTLIKCVYWGGPVTSANAVNDGQWRNNYHVVIAGSNGYVNQSIDAADGFDGPQYLGGRAFDPPNDCNNKTSLVASQYWNDGKPYDSRRCAAACTAQTSADATSPCYFFNTYIISKNGQPLGQYCAMYSQAWDDSHATLSESNYNGDKYSVSYSYYFTNHTNNGLPCQEVAQPSEPTETSAPQPSATAAPDGPALQPPECDALWILNGLDQTGYNPQNTAFSAKISCGSLKQDMVRVYQDGYKIPEYRYSVNENGIDFPSGMPSGHTTLVLMALDCNGYPFLTGFDLIFGYLSLPVTLTDVDGRPVSGATVYANTTGYNGFTQIAVTDDNGQVTFQNIPALTIGLTAFTTDNQIAVAGVYAGDGNVQMKLIPFHEPAESANYDFSNGLDGWSGSGKLSVHGQTPSPSIGGYNPYGSYPYPPPPPPSCDGEDCGPPPDNITAPIIERRRGGSAFSRSRARRQGGQDMDLYVDTASTQSLQTASATFKTFPFTKVVFIRFKFVTSEVPGGYFGSRFNDYFIVTIRSDLGDVKTKTESMNSLGRAAFDDQGATDWMELRLNVPKKCKSVQFDIAVSNVGDSAFNSEVIVDKAGDLDCEECGNCPKCRSDPMCSPICQTRQPGTCDFYRNCMEESKPCADDPGSYALNYGEKNCNAYRNNLNNFTPQGQSFVLGTMMCLQDALRPAVNCDATCSAMREVAFNSHPKCYVDNGFCGLTCGDYWQVLLTIGGELRTLEAMKQVAQTAVGCTAHIKEALSEDACGDTILRAIIYATLFGVALIST